MSASPFFYIECFNHKTNEWEKVDVYTKIKGEYEPVDVWWWNGTHELFSILGAEESHDVPEFNGIHRGLPVSASAEMYKIFESHCWGEEDWSYVPDVKWFNVADAKLYLHTHPTIVDLDAKEDWCLEHQCEWNEAPELTRPSPLEDLLDRVMSMVEMWDWMWDINRSYSDLRVIYWISW